MNAHQQLCGLALAVNLIADHWTLLIVRELLPGPRRFSDLKAGLVPIASNLLSARLKEMTKNDLVDSVDLGEIPVTVYALTPRGRALREVVESMVRWAIPEFISHLGQGFKEDPRWLLVALPALVGNGSWTGAATAIRIHVPGMKFVLQLEPNRPASTHWEGRADVTLTGTYTAILGLFSGWTPLNSPAAPKVEGESPGWQALVDRWAQARALRETTENEVLLDPGRET